MNSFKPTTLIIAVLATLIMGLVPVLVKSVSANVATIGLARLVVTVFFMTLIIFYNRGVRHVKSFRDWGSLSIIGIVFGLHWLCYFISIKLSSASLGAIGVSTFGIHLLLLNWLIKGQKVSWFDCLTVLLCFCGCLLVVPEFNLGNSVTVGLLFGVLSGLLYACLPLLHQRISHIPTLTRAWGQFIFAFIVFLPLSGQSRWDLSGSDWIKLLVLGVLCTLIAHSLWVKASTELPGVLTSLIYYLYIPMAVVLSAIFLKETINLPMIIGGVLILGANISQSVVSWKKYRQ